jgi:hypothetical protein
MPHTATRTSYPEETANKAPDGEILSPLKFADIRLPNSPKLDEHFALVDR